MSRARLAPHHLPVSVPVPVSVSVPVPVPAPGCLARRPPQSVGGRRAWFAVLWSTTIGNGDGNGSGNDWTVGLVPGERVLLSFDPHSTGTVWP